MQLGTVGSGLDVETIVKALVDADVAPKTNSINRREAAIKAEVTAIGSLTTVLSSLESSLTDLADASAFDLLKIDNPDSVESVQTGSPTVGSYSIDVNTLADSQVLASGGFANSSAVVGTGTLTFKIGTPTYASGSSGAYSDFTADNTKTVTITIDDTNKTVSGIRDAINASSVGITASLVLDGTQTRLLLTADDSGAATAISVSADDDDLDDTNSSGLSQLAYNIDSGSFVGNVTEARSSKDASFTLNGLSLTSSSNTITGLVDGLDVTLKKVTTSTDTIRISKDSSGIEAKVQAFVDAYNSYQTTLTSLMDYEDAAGALAGDTTARRIQSVIRATTTGIQNLAGNAYTALSDIGITSDRYGKLEINSSTFQSKLTADPDAMQKLFAGATITSNLDDNTDSTGLADLLIADIDTYANSSTGMLSAKTTRLNESLTDIADDRLEVISRMEALEERYTRQFTAMDTLVGKLQGTSDFLTNQMDAIKAAANR